MSERDRREDEPAPAERPTERPPASGGSDGDWAAEIGRLRRTRGDRLRRVFEAFDDEQEER